MLSPVILAFDVIDMQCFTLEYPVDIYLSARFCAQALMPRLGFAAAFQEHPLPIYPP